MDFAFGPVPSRRLGRSLGINNIPPKICSYACVYCQLGNTIKMQTRRQGFYQTGDIVKPVKKRVAGLAKDSEKVDYLAFVPDGEPTLDINIGRHIDSLKGLGIPLAVISNSSLIDKPDVRRDLSKADWISFKIDTVDEALWRKINRPHGRLKLDSIQDGLLKFRDQFNGTFASETMLIRGLNDSNATAEATGRFLKQLQPDIAYLSVPTRPPADKSVLPAEPGALNRVYQVFTSYIEKVEVISGYEGNAFSCTGDVCRDILNITAVHPMRKEAIGQMLRNRGLQWRMIEQMIAEGLIIETRYKGNIYYLRRF